MHNMYTTQNHYPEGKKPDIKKYTLYITFIWNSRKWQIIYNHKKNTSVVAYTQGFREKWNAAKEEETPRDDKNFLNLDCIIQNSLICTLQIPVSGSATKILT